jgi:hypothetical protein
MRFSQLVILAVLTTCSIMADYGSIIMYSTDLLNITGLDKSRLEFRLPFYLLMKITLTPMFTHVFGNFILKRFYVSSTLKYFLI